MNCFAFPLIEETRADLCSSITNVSTAPTYEILEIKDAEPPSYMNYAIKIGRNQDTEFDADIYEPSYGDLIAFTVARPKCIDDLYTLATTFTVALVQRVKIEKDDSVLLVISSKPIDPGEGMHTNLDIRNLFAVFLTNMTTNLRIWEAMNFQLDGRNLNIINKVLQHDSVVRMTVYNLISCVVCCTLTRSCNVHNYLSEDTPSFYAYSSTLYICIDRVWCY